MVISAQPKTFGASFWTPAGLGKPNAVLDSLSAMMGAWRPGEEGGTAVVDIITGAVNPSGRLTHTWPAKAGQAHSVVSNSFHMPATRAGGQFAFTTGPAKPLFPFGSSPGPQSFKGLRGITTTTTVTPLGGVRDSRCRTQYAVRSALLFPPFEWERHLGLDSGPN